jgi:hypothetical protein
LKCLPESSGFAHCRDADPASTNLVPVVPEYLP